MKHAQPVIWFLKLASAYRDMILNETFDDFNIYNHTGSTYWLLGCSGLFGSINMTDLCKIAYYQIYLNPYVKAKQAEGFNCGVIWCLFVYDKMFQVAYCYCNVLSEGNKQLSHALGIE